MVLLIILLFAGMPIGATMAFLALMGLAYVAGLAPAFNSMGSSPFRTAASYDLSVVPSFVLMGAYCFYSGLSRDLYNTAYPLDRTFPRRSGHSYYRRLRRIRGSLRLQCRHGGYHRDGSLT